VVYANRDFELGYLNPLNFLFAEEQVQGDLDNKLMAIDFKWRVLPGLTSYGTWFFDELDFWKLFSGWWGNKFIFQLGATYYLKANLPSLNIEYTAARPWTYSHERPINSYTSGNRILGLRDGPNTSSIILRSTWQVSDRLDVHAEYEYLQRGDDSGNDVFSSYSLRGDFDSVDSSFLSGNLVTESYSKLALNYYISHSSSLILKIQSDKSAELGISLIW